MSHPMYNPFAAGKQMPPQGPYGVSGGQMERDPRRPPPHLGPGSSFSSAGSPAMNRGPSGGPIPSLLSLPVNYRPERSKAPVDENIDQCLDLNISRAREEAAQNSASQNTQTTNFNKFPNVQRDTFPLSNTAMPSYVMPPAAQVNRPFTVDRGSTSLDWAPLEESSKMYPSASSSFLGSGDGGIQPFVGLGNYDTSISGKSALPQEAIHPKYTSESASNILFHFGLLKDDLDHLTSFPEHQITPENLPFILRQIRLEKAKRSSNSVQSTPYGEAQPMRSMGEMDKLIPSRGPVVDPDQKTSTVVTQSNVIDYGHTSKSELSSFGPLNKDTDLRQLVSEVPKALPSKKPAPAHQAASKIQPSKPPSNLIRGVHPGRPGLVLIGSNAQSRSNDQRRSTGQASKAPKLKMQNKAKGGQKQQLQMHQRPPQPKVAPATKPAPLLLIPCRPSSSTRGPGQMDALTRLGPSNHLPPPSLMEDYAAATPRIFPHTCSLCMKQCTSVKEWLSHQNTSLHLENCRLLRGRYPEWDGSTLEFLSASGLDSEPAPATPGHNLLSRHQKSFHENASRSLSPRHRGSEDRKEKQDRRDKRFSPSRSHSPHHYHVSESRRERRSSRSRSPQTSRHIQRPRSHSYDRPTSSYLRSRSRSYERLSSPRRREAQRSSSRRSYERRFSPRRSDERRLSPRRSHERRSSGERSVPQHMRSRSADRLAKRLLEKKAVHSLSKQSDLEAMVKTLAPVLLAELANLKSSSAAMSSSSSRKEKNTPSHKSSKATSSRPRSGTSSSATLASGGSTLPCIVNLSGVFSSLSHSDIVEAMKQFGKVKCVVLFRSTLKARVFFEKSEDAKKLQRLKRWHVKGLPVSVDKRVSTALKKPLQKPASEKKSGASKSQTTKSHTTLKVKKPSSSETRNTTRGNLVSKAKVLVSKAKNISTKQVAKTVNKSSGKSAGQSAGGRRDASVVPKSKTAGKRPPADKTKKPVTNTKSVNNEGKSATNKGSEVRKQSNKPAEGKTSTSKPKATVKAEERSVKASSEKQPSTASHSESSAEHRKTKTDAVEKQKQSPKKTDTQQGSAKMESVTSSVSPSDCSNKKEQLKPQTSSSVSETPKNVPAGSSTITSVSGPSKNAAKLSHVDEDISKVSTTEINKHRQTKGATSENKDKESTTMRKTPPEDAKQKNTQHTKDKNKGERCSSGRFDELDFSSGDFVTVDEINEDMVVEDQPSSSKPTSRETKDRQSSAARKTSTTSASSSSKPSKGSLSSHSTSSSSDKCKSFPEPKKSKTKTSYAKGTKSSHSSSFSKSVETPPSSGQKVQSNKSKAPVRSSKPSSSGRSTCSSATATKSSIKTQQEQKKDVRPSESALAKSDHKVSAEGCAAKTVKDETVKAMKKSELKVKKKDTDGKSTEEKIGNIENKQILDSVNEKSDEQKNKEDNQDRRTEIQPPGPEQDQVIHQGGLQVAESTDNDNARSDECQEMEVDEPTKLQGCALKDQALTADDGDEGPTMMQVSEKDETKEAQSSEGSSVRGTADRSQVTSEETNQTPNSCVAAANVKQKDENILSEEVCKTSKEVGQTSKEDHNDSKDTLKDQKLVVPTDLSKTDNEPTDEEVYKVIDSLEDQPTTTETESETEKKEQRKTESKTASRDVRPTRQSCSRSRTSKSEEKEKSPKQLDKTRKYATKTKDSKAEKEEESLENFEEIVYEVVDAIEDDSVQETSTTGSSSRRRTARGNKKDEKASPSVEEPIQSDKEEEEMFTILDSVEEESPSDKPVVTRSTRGRRETTAKKVEENTKAKEDKIPTRRRCTPVRDSKDGEKTPKTDVPLKESTSTKKSDATKEAELKKRQAAATKTENEQDRRSLEKETRNQRSQSSDEGGANGKTASDEKHNHKEGVEKMEVAACESVILHEMGEKEVSDTTTYNKEITEGEPQELDVSNEVAETEEGQQEKQGTLEAHSQIQERQSVDPPNPENFSASDEAGQNDDKKENEEETTQTSNSSKRKNDNTAVDKREQELTEPEAKRFCSQCPSVSADLQLPPFNPNNPLGEEFVVPKAGFFCNLCSVFYLNETTAKKIHCSSKKHYDNLQKHYQKLKMSEATTQSVQESVSD